MLSGVPVVRWKQLNQERDHGSGLTFLQKVRNLIKKNGSADIVDVDESGLEESTSRPFAGPGQKEEKDLTWKDLTKVVCAPTGLQVREAKKWSHLF